MSDDLFSQVQRRIWTDKRFRALSKPDPNARDLFLYLLTTPRATTIPGLLILGETSLAEELEWPVKGVQRCLAELETAGMVKVDRVARLLWLPNALKHNPPRSSKNVAGWKKHWRLLPECGLLTEATAVFESSLRQRGSSFLRAFLGVLGVEVPEGHREDDGIDDASEMASETASKMPSKIGSETASPSRSQDQEQDQEQDSRSHTARVSEREQPDGDGPCSLQAFGDLLRGVPALEDVSADGMAVSELHEGFVMTHKGRATLELATHAVATFIAQGVPGDRLAARKLLGRFLCNQRPDRGSAPSSVPAEVRVTLEVFGEVWAARKRRPFVASVGDEKHAAALVEAARPHAATLRIAGREVVRFWAERYLADAERFVADQEHPLRLLPGRLTTYGTPKPRKAPPSAPTAAPAGPPAAPAPPPPDLAAGLNEAARAAREGVALRRPGATT